MGDIFTEMLEANPGGVRVSGFWMPVFSYETPSLSEAVSMILKYDDLSGLELAQHVFSPEDDTPVIDEHESWLIKRSFNLHVRDAFVLLYNYVLGCRQQMRDAGIDVGDPIPGEDKQYGEG